MTSRYRCDALTNRAMKPLVHFWTPSPITQRRGEKGQDHLSAHARAKPIVAHTTSTWLFYREIQKLGRKLFQHASGKNVGERSYDAEKTCQTELREYYCKVCGITTPINARAVISNPAQTKKVTGKKVFAAITRGHKIVSSGSRTRGIFVISAFSCRVPVS